MSRYKFGGGGGLTQGDADARYAPLSATKPVVASTEATATVVNTVTETALATLATPTGVAAGDRLIFRASGDMINNSGGTVNVTLRFKIGATTVLASSAASVGTASAQRRKWVMEVNIALESTSAQRCGAQINISAAGSSSWPIGTASVAYGYGTGAEDLTTSKNCVFTVEMDVANAAADWRLHAASLTHNKHA